MKKREQVNITVIEWEIIRDLLDEFIEKKEAVYNGDIRREIEECFAEYCCEHIRKYNSAECELIVEDALSVY
jgi:hypothetical protein